VAIVTDPADYAVIAREMTSTKGAVGAETRIMLAKKPSHTLLNMMVQLVITLPALL